MVATFPLVFPIRPFETVTSYVSRLTQYCGTPTPADLCLDHGFRWQEVVRGDQSALRSLSNIAGADLDQILRWSVQSNGSYSYTVAGERAVRRSLVRSRIRVCPHCIVSDKEKSGDLGPYRRIFWQFVSVRSCPQHQVPLIGLKPEKYTLQNYDFLLQVQKQWKEIEKAAAGKAVLPSTALESYLIDRLHGRRGAPFLDSMPLYISTRLCEVLGFVIRFGADRPISEASETELSQAGETGFQALRGSEQDLYAAMDGLISPIATRTVRHQSDFGAFFEWLRNSSLGPEFETLKDKVRAYIFRTYPFQKGALVLGKPCPDTKAFTIHGACRELGIRRERMNRFLLEAGAASRDGESQEVWLDTCLAQSALDELKKKIDGRMSFKEAASHLNIGIHMLEEFHDAGLLVATTDGLDQRPKFQRQAVDNFVENLAPKSCDVPVRHDDLSPIIRAAARVHCRTVEIIELILAGKLGCYQLQPQKTDIATIGVSLSALKRALPPLSMPALSKEDTRKRLRVTHQTVVHFGKTGLLDVTRLRNPKSRQFLDAISLDSIGKFERRFVSLGQLSRTNCRAAGPLKMSLEAMGICPEEDVEGLSSYYDRRKITRQFKKMGLVVPEPQGQST